jgi:hypothetical protein
MLALTDEQMARVLLAGTGLRVGQQRKLLRELRQQADKEWDATHPPKPPSRNARCMRRIRNGDVRVSFVLDPQDAAAFMHSEGIALVGIADRETLSAAFQMWWQRLVYGA